MRAPLRIGLPLCIASLWVASAAAQTPIEESEVVATFSIVGYDPETRDLGIAVQSRFFSVGSVVPYAKAGVGAVATQAAANVAYGPDGLKLLEEGKSAQETVDALLAPDNGRDRRQVAVVDAQGRVATFTGPGCSDWAGGIAGDRYAAQGNILAGEAVVKEMARAFEEARAKRQDERTELAEWLVAALQAGQAAGGDRRGMQSAAVLVVRAGAGYGGNDRYIDVRVDDHESPIDELARVLSRHPRRGQGRRGGRRGARQAAPPQRTPPPAPAAQSLGALDFPNTGARNAQEPFVQGMLALHSFFYDEAADRFKQAQEADPKFVMAIWGEAMTHNHPLWSQQDRSAALEIMKRLGETKEARLAAIADARERAYWEALEVLYGEGEKYERDRAYMESMRRLAEQYPDDIEARAFYSLSLQGAMRRGQRDERLFMQSGAIADEILRNHPDHPGAAHYLIHAMDDPVHAPLALWAARIYAKIAPAANHAQHMPSHIFVQLGMWQDTIDSNVAAYGSSVAWADRTGRTPADYDYHSMAWLQYGQLQRGLYADARKSVDTVSSLLDRVAERDRGRIARAATGMDARELVERADWPALAGASAAERLRILTAAGMGDPEAAGVDSPEALLARLTRQRETAENGTDAYAAKGVAVCENEVAAAIAFAAGRGDEALDRARRAAEIEATMDPPSGPPSPLKPATELFGEMLLALDRPADALAQFQLSLERTPNRTASLLGAARAAAGANDRAAAETYYSKVAEVLAEADRGHAGLREARRFLAR